MPKFIIQHTTRYVYEEAVRDSANQIMLYPVIDDFQEVIQQVITITGHPTVNVHEDYYGNKVGTFTFAQPHNEMIIYSQLSIETRERKLPAEDVPFELQWNELKNLKYDLTYIDFFHVARFAAMSEVEKLVHELHRAEGTPLQTAKDFTKYVFDNFTYQKGITTVETKLDEIWKLKSGVCQDFAHMLLAMLRLSGIPARYVSGYICSNKAGMRGEGATHAWVEAYLPYYGWLGLDPTNNCVVTSGHVKLAVGKDFSDCSPVKGTYRGTSNHTLEVSVTVASEDGQMPVEDIKAVPEIKPVTQAVVSRNSFRRHQEMQMQQ